MELEDEKIRFTLKKIISPEPLKNANIKGNYLTRTSQQAAGKALTSIVKHIKKYRDWKPYASIVSESPENFKAIIDIENTVTGKTERFQVYREQSEPHYWIYPRTTNTVVFKWKTVAKKIK